MPFSRMTTRSLSSPKAVERSQRAPPSSNMCPRSLSSSMAFWTSPFWCRLVSLYHTSKPTLIRASVAFWAARK
ncbi:hypothetical protein D3C86_1650900 [compost metagenome]